MSLLLTLSRSIFPGIKPALPVRLKHSKAQFAIQENSMWKSK